MATTTHDRIVHYETQANQWMSISREQREAGKIAAAERSYEKVMYFRDKADAFRWTAK